MFCIIWSKGCKRCRGDLSLERDEDGFYVACIQCSAVDIELTKVAQLRTATPAKSKSEERKQRELIAVADD